ncbi:uncharacterized protein LOC123564515 [Mercenaria mercenaria]|uniref:uncharacterized protein LOC123564515 n=1 Tax=Mercenaria mercenaria TaxID=6596 RepID=UPI00234F54DC|nr:uncharacterized protein LOC123564515 [Mercenaria mercenaria]
MARAHDVARKYLKVSAECSKAYYDGKGHLNTFKPGDLVWYLHETKKPGVAPKLEKRYDGPYLVKAKKSPLNYVIQLERNSTEKLVHHDKLKPYHVMERKTHPRGRAYRCLHCAKKGKEEINSKTRIENHIYKYHVPNDEQPFWCRMCQFRSRSKDSLFRHVQTYARHKNVMKEKGYVASEPFLVCNDNPYRLGEEDFQVLDKDESSAWWSKKASTDIISKALSLEVPEIYTATKYLQNVTEKDIENVESERNGADDGRRLGKPGDHESFDDEAGMNFVVETSKGRGVDVDDSEGVALDLRKVLENSAADRPDESDKWCEKIRTATNVRSNTEEGSNMGPLDLRVVKEDKGKRTSPLDFSVRKNKEAEQLKKTETDVGKGAVGQATQRNVIITGERASCGSKPSEVAAGRNETGKDLKVNGLQNGKVQEKEVVDETAEAARVIVEEMEGEERISDHMNIQEDSEEIEEMTDGGTDARGIEAGLNQGKVKETEMACTNGGKEGDKGHRETDNVGKEVSDESVEESDRQKRKIKESELRSRKRVRQSLKKYRDVSASSRESSTSSSSSSSDSDDAEAIRQRKQVIESKKTGNEEKSHEDERDSQSKKEGPEQSTSEDSKLKKAKVNHEKEASSASRETKRKDQIQSQKEHKVNVTKRQTQRVERND